MANDGQKKSMVLKALDTVERVGNRLPDPAVIFLILTGIVILVSAPVSYTHLDVYKRQGMTNIPKADDQVDQWRSVMFLYDSALKKVNTKIEILNNEFANRYDYNPIEHIKSRLKSAESIVMKLKKDGYEVTIENMMECLSDIAGIRIICSFTSDIYQIAGMIADQGDVTVLHVKDYICLLYTSRCV